MRIFQNVLKLGAVLALMLSFNVANATGEVIYIQQMTGNPSWMTNVTFTLVYFANGPKGFAGHVPELAVINNPNGGHVLHGTTSVELRTSGESWINHIYMHGTQLIPTFYGNDSPICRTDDENLSHCTIFLTNQNPNISTANTVAVAVYYFDTRTQRWYQDVATASWGQMVRFYPGGNIRKPAFQWIEDTTGSVFSQAISSIHPLRPNIANGMVCNANVDPQCTTVP